MEEKNCPAIFRNCPVCNGYTPAGSITCPHCGVNLEIARDKNVRKSIPTQKKSKWGAIFLSITTGCFLCFAFLLVYGFINDTIIRPAFFMPTQTAISRTAPPELANCLHWSSVSSNMSGKHICVYGKVIEHRSDYDQKMTYLLFGQRGFYLSSSSGWSQSLEGICIQSEGTVLLDSLGYPFINISGDDLYSCLPWMEQ